MAETVQEVAEKITGPLTSFAVQAGVATVTVAVCWAVVKILMLLFA